MTSFHLTPSAIDRPTDLGRTQGRLDRIEETLGARGYAAAIAAVLAVGFVLRYYLATHTAYIWDEEREWIPVALSISFAPESVNLPLRTDYHGAFAAYFMRLGEMLFGSSHFGFRAGSVVTGVLTIAVVAEIAHRIGGRVAALIAAVIMATNEFHIMVSTVAIQTSYYLLFEALAVLFVALYLERNRPLYLYLAAISVSFGFLAYEIGALMVPALFFASVFRPFRAVWKSPHLYGAAAVAFVFVAPDLFDSLSSRAEADLGYGKLLNRFGSLGFKPVYLAFFFRDIFEPAYHLVLRRPAPSEGSEYVAMNLCFGAAIFLGVLGSLSAVTRAGRGQGHPALALLLSILLFVFGFFTLIEPPANKPIAHWIWVGVVIIPCAVMTGVAVRRGPLLATLILGCLGVGLVWSGYNLLANRMGIPQMRVQLVPEFLSAAENDFVPVTAHFNLCDACVPQSAPVLVDVSIEPLGGLAGRSALESGDVRDAMPGVADTGLSLRVVSDHGPAVWMARIYSVSYLVTMADGRSAQIAGTARVPHDKDTVWPSVFWAPAPPGSP